MKKAADKKQVSKINDPIAFMHHVALAWHFAKLQSPKLNREKWFFREFTNINAMTKDPTIKKITSTAIATVSKVSFIFDQYFYFMFGKMPCPFSHKLDNQFQRELHVGMKNK